MPYLGFAAISFLALALGFVGSDVVTDGEFDETRQLFANTAIAAFETLIGVLPDSEGLPSIFDTAIVNIGLNLALINLVMPLDHIFTIITIFIFVQGIMVVWRISLFILGLVRGVNYMTGSAVDMTPTDMTLDMRPRAGSMTIDMRRK